MDLVITEVAEKFAVFELIALGLGHFVVKLGSIGALVQSAPSRASAFVAMGGPGALALPT